MKTKLTLGILLSLLVACQPQYKDQAPEFEITYEKFELDNGLDVVFHIDRSDPVVAVSITAHVGSAREKPGRTGFAHLFEHLLFLESQNLGKGGLDKMSARIGGSGANGFTTRDLTNYLQTVPKDALEKMIWAEADKLGWFINTVSEQVLAKEKQVVKNEKRQGIDNQPYGHTYYVIDKNLYPEGHPYNWQVIGSLDDIQNATLADVKEFFRRWYVPNNVTLVISGDFDTNQAKKWVHKYFDEIPRGESVVNMAKEAAVLNKTVKVYHEDNFANLPELTMVWPSVELYHEDSYPLEVLARYLSEGKKAPLYKEIVDRQKLAPDVAMYNYTSELAGQMILAVRAYDDTDLDAVDGAIQKAFANFESEGIPEKDLNRIKAGQETSFYNGLSSVLGKGMQLAQYNTLTGDPGFITNDIGNILAVTTEDVMKVYEKYIKDKNYVATSFVPKGEPELALDESVMAGIVEEVILQDAEETFDASIVADYESTPSSFDRSKEPPYGKPPVIIVPDIWEDQLDNGLKVYGIENNEVPLVQFNLIIDGGQLLENSDITGVSNLIASMMTRGTKNKTPVELEEAIEQLGSSISVYAGKESIQFSGQTLSKNYNATIDLLEEIITEPRWDEEEFELVKQQAINRIRQQKANPNSIARNAYNQLLFGAENIRSKNILGTIESLNAITIDNLKSFYSNNFSPSVAKMNIVGQVKKPGVLASLQILNDRWASKEVVAPPVPLPPTSDQSAVYFYNVPGAKQSVLRIGYLALPVTDQDFYPATVMNYILGGGGFASQLTQELREGKGYTYGIFSRFSGTKNVGPFTISSSVRSNITVEALMLIKQIMLDYGENYSEKDLETTKGFLIKSNARAFETAGAKLNMLGNISNFGWDYDYINDREAIVKNMTTEKISALAEKYLNQKQMFWLVVGDAETQMGRLKKLGFGDPFLINPE